MMQRSHGGDQRGGIPEPVLLVEHDGGKPVTRDLLGHQWRGHSAPSGENRFAGAQAPGQGEGGHVSRSS